METSIHLMISMRLAPCLRNDTDKRSGVFVFRQDIERQIASALARAYQTVREGFVDATTWSTRMQE